MSSNSNSDSSISSTNVKEQTCDNGGAETMPETAPNQADNAIRDVIALSASSCCVIGESAEATGLSQSCNPVEKDFEIPFDLLCDNPSPYFNARLSTIGALFISYDPDWMRKLFGWMEDAEKRGKLINKNGTVTCPPFQFSSSEHTNL